MRDYKEDNERLVIRYENGEAQLKETEANFSGQIGLQKMKTAWVAVKLDQVTFSERSVNIQ
jgi:hypothetical protein